MGEVRLSYCCVSERAVQKKLSKKNKKTLGVEQMKSGHFMYRIERMDVFAILFYFFQKP